MVDGLCDSHALVGIELQRTLQEVVHLGSKELKELRERLPLANPEGFDVVAGAFVADEVDIGGSANGTEDYRAK